jgi:AmpD protein
VLNLDPTGNWFDDARRVPSPNFDSRPAGCGVDLVVVHGISLPPGEFGGPHIERLFCNRLDPHAHDCFRTVADLRVSAHLLIRRDGGLVQFVALSDRAWHAGESRFGDRVRCNDFSIGIELEGTDCTPYEAAQYERLGGVCRSLMHRWPAIGSDRVVGHSDIAPDRKTDPGPAFDWRLLRSLLAASDR